MWARQLLNPAATAAVVGVGVYALLGSRGGSVQDLDAATKADIARAGVARAKGAPLNAIPPLTRALDEMMKAGNHPDAVVQVALFLAGAQTEARRYDAALATLQRATSIADTLASKVATGSGRARQLSACRELQILGAVQATALAMEDAPRAVQAVEHADELLARRCPALLAGVTASYEAAVRSGQASPIAAHSSGTQTAVGSGGDASSSSSPKAAPPALSPSERRLLLDYAAMLHEGSVAAVAAVAPSGAWPSAPPSAAPSASAGEGRHEAALAAAQARAAAWSDACLGALHLLLAEAQREGARKGKDATLLVGSSAAGGAAGGWDANGAADGSIPLAAYCKQINARLAQHAVVRGELAASFPGPAGLI